MARRRALVRTRWNDATSCCPHCGGALTIRHHRSGAIGSFCGCRWWRYESPDGAIEEEDERFLEWIHGGDDDREGLDRPVPSVARASEALPSWDEIVEYRPAS